MNRLEENSILAVTTLFVCGFSWNCEGTGGNKWPKTGICEVCTPLGMYECKNTKPVL
jgi:hypothetical protein